MRKLMMTSPMAHPDASKESSEKRFHDLAAQWKAETRFCSSSTEMASHAACRAIIAMGAIPLILRDLEQELNHWFPALTEMTHEDPVPPGDRGVVEKMRQAWLQWGREKHYL